jgi:hypothetical protein
MNFLNSQQLAFLLDIKKEDARARMCNAWEKVKGIPKDSNANHYESVHGAAWNHKNKIQDSYPQAMPIQLLAEGLGIPALQHMVDDIWNNYLIRKSTKKYILWDFPEKEIALATKAGKGLPIRVRIPPALRSMLPSSTVNEIHEHWKNSFTYIKDGNTLSKIDAR